ncbi:MAG TPA: Gfo/Idh/MocA family oxidoreductase [Acidothermaceae bacterium]|jgi:predicted dehydrogenase
MTETKSVRWGILGASNIAKKFIADAQSVDGTEVVAVGARDPERAKAYAQENGIPTAYRSWEELAEAPDIDVVYVSTVHSWHYAGAKLCLENGKSVLVEKPFTVHLRDAEELVSIARERGLFLMEAMWTRCNPLNRELKEFVARGDLGEVIQIQSNLGPSAGRNPRLWDLSVGGGILLECGVYPLAFAYQFLGEPERVVAVSHFADTGIDDQTSLLLEYAGGASASLTTSVSKGVSTPHHSFGDVIGTGGWISVPTNAFFPEEYTIHLSGSSDPIHVERPKVGNGYTEEAAEVSRCIREGLTESPVVPLDDTVGAMRVIDAAYQQVGIKYPEAPTLARA